MPTVIKLKRGTTTPTNSDITSGEVAVDTSAKKIYINDGGTVKLIGVGDAASSPVSVLVKNSSGTTIKTRIGLSGGGTTSNIKNSAGTTLKTLVGPFSTVDTSVGDDTAFNDASDITTTGSITAGGTITAGAYNAGQVIEELHAVCNKTDLHGRATIENVTSAQTLSTTYADATGSVVTSYTPPSGTTMIVYEYTSHLRWEDAHAISHWKLYYQVSGGTWTEVEKARTNRNGYYPEDKQILRWVFEVGAASDDSTLGIFNAATPQLGFKWQVRDYSASNERGLLHQTTYWDGAGTPQYSQPMIMIKAIG